MPSTPERNEIEFVSFEPSARESISGKSLMLGAYGVILGVLLIYAFVLLLRSRSTLRKTDSLERRLLDSKKISEKN